MLTWNFWKLCFIQLIDPNCHHFFSETSSAEEDILRTKQLIDHALEFSEGDFLFLKTIIKNNYQKHCQKHPDKIDAESIPESLGEIYATSFTERYKDGDLGEFELFLEVLLAAHSPPTLFELDKILNYHYKNYNTRKIANKLSQYLKSDIGGPKQTDRNNGIFVRKSRGHRFFVDYLFHFYNDRGNNLTLK